MPLVCKFAFICCRKHTGVLRQRGAFVRSYGCILFCRAKLNSIIVLHTVSGVAVDEMSSSQDTDVEIMGMNSDSQRDDAGGGEYCTAGHMK